MSGKVMKRLRRITFGEQSIRDRKYFHGGIQVDESGRPVLQNGKPVIVHANIVTDPKRRGYQKLKKHYAGTNHKGRAKFNRTMDHTLRNLPAGSAEKKSGAL